MSHSVLECEVGDCSLPLVRAHVGVRYSVTICLGAARGAAAKRKGWSGTRSFQLSAQEDSWPSVQVMDTGTYMYIYTEHTSRGTDTTWTLRQLMSLQEPCVRVCVYEQLYPPNECKSSQHKFSEGGPLS